MERVDRIFVAAARGVEVRYLVTINVLKHDSSIRSEITPKRIATTIAYFIRSLNEGLPIDIRFNDGPQNTYQFMSINNDSLAFMISENPLTAAWITRVFNPDLIDNAIASFDLQWEKAVSLSKLSPEYLKKAEIPPNACIVEALADVYRTMGEEPH